MYISSENSSLRENKKNKYKKERKRGLDVPKIT